MKKALAALLSACLAALPALAWAGPTEKLPQKAVSFGVPELGRSEIGAGQPSNKWQELRERLRMGGVEQPPGPAEAPSARRDLTIGAQRMRDGDVRAGTAVFDGQSSRDGSSESGGPWSSGGSWGLTRAHPHERYGPRSIPSFREVHKPWRHHLVDLYDNFAELMRDTALPLVLTAVLGASIGLGYGFHHEAARERSIPLAFSEISQIEREAAWNGRSIGPMTRYLTSANDLVMKILESSNDAYADTYSGDSTRRFASNLDNRIRYKFHHYEIQDYFRELPQQADAAYAEFRPFVSARDAVNIANGHLNSAWSEFHWDHYHTEYYTTTETDSKGNTRTVTRSRQVYDYTTHSYTYHAAEGAAAVNALYKALGDNSGLAFNEELPVASKTNAEGEYAAEKSRKNQRKGKPPLTSAELLELSRTWKSGSTLLADLPEIQQRWNALHGDTPDWEAASRTAHSTTYITYSHFDSGPREYQVANRALSNGLGFTRSVDEVAGGISFGRAAGPALGSDVQQLIDVELNHAKGGAKPGKLRSAIMDRAKTLYALNFKKGLDVQGFRVWAVALFMALFGAIGWGLGWPLRYLIGRFGWFRPI